MRTWIQNIGLFLGTVLFIILLFFHIAPDRPVISRMAAVATLMAVWWVTESIPLAATALLPMILYPVLGILPAGDTAPIYINSTIFMFIGGFMIALAMEKWQLHKRIAFLIILFVGGGPSRIIFGFMVAAGFLSMWISNTATALMMLPVGMAIAVQLEDEFGEEYIRNFTIVLMLGIAYACSIGGCATLIGTPPNLVLQRIFGLTFPHAPDVSFGRWFFMAFPLTLLMGGVVWLILTKICMRIPKELRVSPDIVKEEYARLAAISYEEIVVSIVFVCTALLWIFREKIVVGAVTIPGWAELFPFRDLIDDGTIALFMAGVMFLIPDRSGGRILDQSVFQEIPWGIVLLFGGGFALAKGFQITHLSEFIGQKMIGLTHVHPLMIIIVFCFILTFLTELTSNTATSQMILPIVASMAVTAKLNPLLLMVPATLSCSCAFMLPVATPPNAIIFASGRVRITDMARIGFLINLVGLVMITCYFYWLGSTVMNIKPDIFPEWAITGS